MLQNKKEEANGFLFLCFSEPPLVVESNHGRYQQNADCHNAGNGGGIHTLGAEPDHIAPDGIIHGKMEMTR